MDFLQHRILPSNRSDAMNRKEILELFRRSLQFKSDFNQAPLRCIVDDK